MKKLEQQKKKLDALNKEQLKTLESEEKTKQKQSLKSDQLESENGVLRQKIAQHEERLQ